jgi:endonuclease YncB( thermonuclease family)
MIMDAYIRKVEVIKVLDGDTFDGIVDLGYGVRIHKRFRLLECDTPEIGQPLHDEASKFTSDMIMGKTVFVQSEKPDVYGRYLAYVYIDENGDTLNKQLVDKGLANVYNYQQRKHGYK